MADLLATAANATIRVEAVETGPPIAEFLLVGLVLLFISALISWGVTAALHRWLGKLGWVAHALNAGAFPLMLMLAVLVFGQVYFTRVSLASAVGSLFPLLTRGQILFGVILAGALAASFAASWRFERARRKRAIDELSAFN